MQKQSCRGLERTGQGSSGAAAPCYRQQTRSVSWCITDVHLNEMRVGGGAWLADPWFGPRQAPDPQSSDMVVPCL